MNWRATRRRLGLRRDERLPHRPGKGQAEAALRDRPRYDHGMGSYLGGSAFAMAQQIAEGYILATERTFKRMQLAELQKLAFELEKRQRELRGEQPPLEETAAVQARHRKIQRITSAIRMIEFSRSRRRR
jgi:hypothetical protein